MKIYQVALTLIVVVAGNGSWAHADDFGCAAACGCSSCGDFGSGGFTPQLGNILGRLAKPSCTTCGACDSVGGCDGGRAGECDAGPGCGDVSCGCGDSGGGGCLGSSGLQRLQAGMPNLMQGGMSCDTSCDPCGGLASGWYNGSRPPKRMGGGPFRKYGACWYTAPTEWTLFGVFPLSHHPTCCCDQGAGGTSGGCGADCGCAIYSGDRPAPSPAISHHASAQTNRPLATNQDRLVSVVAERERHNTNVIARRRLAQPLKKSISFRRDNVTRATYSTGTSEVSSVAAQLEEPSRLKTEPEPFVETGSEATVLQPARPMAPLRTIEHITRPNRSSFGKASLKIVK